MESSSISHNQKSTECERSFTVFCFSALWSVFLHALTSLRRLIVKLKSYSLTDALQIFRGGPVACLLLRLRVAASEAWSNDRFRLGVLVGMVAFPAWKSHTFFDINTRIEGFYYVNWVFFFNEIRTYLGVIFLAVGFLIACPQKWSFKWWALPVLMFCVSEIYAHSLYDSYDDFYQSMSIWQFAAIAVLCIPAMVVSIDYLCYRKYHLKDGNTCRMVGVIEMDLPWEKKEKMLKDLAAEYRNYNGRI